MEHSRFDTRGDKVFGVINMSILLLITVIFLYPLIYVLSASLSDSAAILNGEIWLLPVRLSLDAYRRVFINPDIWMGYWNTIKYTVIGTLINLTMTTLTAYPLSRKFPGKGFFTVFFTITMFFSGGLIPLYLVMQRINLIGTFWIMVLPGAISMYNVFLMRTFFQTSIHDSLLDAAKIDGCGTFTTLFRVVLPLSGAIMAVMALMYGVGHWNAYFNAMIFLDKREMYPLQLILREILLQNQVNSIAVGSSQGYIAVKIQLMTSIKYALVVVASFPLLILYPFLQKYFVKGVMIGSIKG